MKNTEKKHNKWEKKTFSSFSEKFNVKEKAMEKMGNLRLILTMGRRKTPKVGFSKTNSICGGGGN